MKTVPGIRLLGFFAIVLAVVFGVYCWATPTPAPTKTYPEYILKFGWHDPKDEDCDTLPLDWPQFHKALQSIAQGGATEYPEDLYNFRTWKNGKPDPDQSKQHGKLKDASEPVLPPEAKGKLASAKTQNTAAVAFSNTDQIKKFVDTLNATSTSTATATP